MKMSPAWTWNDKGYIGALEQLETKCTVHVSPVLLQTARKDLVNVVFFVAD